MDYFSELLESYNKIKKRTFKLTYLEEGEDKEKKEEIKITPEQLEQGAVAAQEFMTTNLEEIRKGTNDSKITLTTAANVPIQFYMGVSKSKQAAGAGYKVTGPRSFSGIRPEGEGAKVDPKDVEAQTEAGKGTGEDVIKADWLGEVGIVAGDIVTISPKLQQNPRNYKLFVGKFVEGASTGEEDDVDRAQGTAEQVRQDQEQAAFDALKKPETIFIDKGYSIDPEDPANIVGAIAAFTETIKDLITYCSTVTKPKPKYCDKQGYYLTGQSNRAFGYKLANGIAIGEDGKKEELTPGLINQVAENHKDFMKFLTGEGDCETIRDKVGSYDGKLFIFGRDPTPNWYKSNVKGFGDPTTGVAIKTPNELQKDALKAVKKQCPDFKERQLTGPSSPGGQNLNTLRATVDEKSMVAAVALIDAKTPDDTRKVLKDIASYIKEKAIKLKDHAAKKAGEEGVALEFEADSKEQILLEQAELASMDGGRPLVRYAMQTIRRHMTFAKAIKATSAGDLSTKGGSGGRGDTVFYFDTKAKANAAAKEVGLDPKTAITKSKDKKGMWELGCGQKDKMDGVGGAKLGEYNTIARLRDAFRGVLGKKAKEDSKFQEGFTEWADKLQFGDITKGEGKKRWDALLKFEETLETDVASMQKLVNDGVTYTGDGKIGTLQPAQVCTELGVLVKEKLSYDDLRDTELGRALGGEGLDFKNAADRNRASELIGRQARIKMVQKAIEDDTNPARQQVAKDWAIRTAIMTGGNYRDIVTLITSYDENRSLAIPHNKPFQEMTKQGADVSFTFPKGGSTIGISAGGVPCSLSFMGTDNVEGRQTRTTLNVDKKTAFAIGKEYSGIPETSENNSTFIQYLEGQKQLLEIFLNQTKHTQSL